MIGELIGGFLGGKQSRKRGGFGLPGLGARRRGGGLMSAGTLLTVGGLIWGALETMQQGNAQAPGNPSAPPSPPGAPPVPAASAPPRGVLSSPGDVGPPPPLPPPLPGAAPSGIATDVPPTLLPLVQLAVSAARADGELSDDEVAVIRLRATALGAGAIVDGELQARRPLDSITPAFTTPEQRQMAYALAFAVVHGEGDVSPGERMYLTQLQRLLRLDTTDAERLERETLAGA